MLQALPSRLLTGLVWFWAAVRGWIIGELQRLFQLLSHLAPYPLSTGSHHQICLAELAESRGKIRCVSHHFYGDLQELRLALEA